MKYVIVGGVAGGASTAARLRRLDEKADVIMFEKGPHVSFSNCCLPYRLSNQVKEHDDLVLMSPAQFHKQYNITARVNSEVVGIDRATKSVKVKQTDGKEYSESYDKLILAPGADAIAPKLEGYENADVFTVKNVVDVSKLYDFINGKGNIKKITVVGGGFIGIEVAENLREADFDVTLVEAENQILRQFDYDMVQIIHKEMSDKGIKLLLGKMAKKYDQNNLILEDGTIVEGDAVVMAIGVRPQTELAIDAGIEVTKSRHIKVNANWQTVSDDDIYAVGDAVEVVNAITHKPFALPLAGPAQKQARQAANHIYGILPQSKGFIGSSCIKVFDYNAASTGLNEKLCKAEGINYDITYIIPQDKVGLMPGSSPFFFKLIYEVPSGRVLGAQAISKGDAAKRVDVVATVIKFNGTLTDMADLELCYAPPVSTAKDPTNMAALVSLNLLGNVYKQVRVDEVRGLVESGACIIDVREPGEYARSHIKNAINIPLSEIRQRLDEIPTDKPVYLHCRSSQRSYNACMMLKANGFDNIYNISGSFLGISFYEYFNDTVTGRDKIVTDYNFN